MIIVNQLPVGLRQQIADLTMAEVHMGDSAED
jgi:hypothetical protein